MLKCEKCNSSLKEDAKFCTACGLNSSAIRTCSRCKQVSASNDKFCRFCGTKFGTSDSGRTTVSGDAPSHPHGYKGPRPVSSKPANHHSQQSVPAGRKPRKAELRRLEAVARRQARTSRNQVVDPIAHTPAVPTPAAAADFSQQHQMQTNYYVNHNPHGQPMHPPQPATTGPQPPNRLLPESLFGWFIYLLTIGGSAVGGVALSQDPDWESGSLTVLVPVMMFSAFFILTIWRNKFINYGVLTRKQTVIHANGAQTRSGGISCGGILLVILAMAVTALLKEWFGVH